MTGRSGVFAIFRRFIDIDWHEIPMSALMFLFWFLAIAVYQLVKPLKNGLFIEAFGAHEELYAKAANILVAGVGAFVFAFLYQRLSRLRTLLAWCLFFIFGFGLSAILIPQHHPLFIWVFYLFGDFISTLWVTAFWAYLTDITSSDQAVRLYGVIGTGGVLGGWFGISVAKFLLHAIGDSGLLILAAGMMVTIGVIVGMVERCLSSGVCAFQPELHDDGRTQPPVWRTAVEGANLVFHSRYLGAIVGIMTCYEFASQILDFVFKHEAERLPGWIATQSFMANVYFFANIVAVIVQLFLVSYVLRRFGVKTALLVLPIGLIVSALGYVLVPMSLTVGLLVVLDNGLNYSIEQTARETLYVPTTPQEKYKARAFTNMFIQRLAKGLAILVVLALGWFHIPVRPMPLITVLLGGLMVGWSLYAGRRYLVRLERCGLPDVDC